jgi:hypothetical protein
MLLDSFLPEFDFTEVSCAEVKASAETTYRAILQITMAELSPFVWILWFLRTLPEKLVGRKEEPRDNNAPYFQQETSDFFTELVNNPPSEYIFGLVVPEDIGRVWKKSSELDFRPSNTEEFLAFTNPAHLKVACNFLIVDGGEPGYVKIRSEFRTGALSMTARKKFSVYWRIISPFSHYIQKQWVKAIKRRAEQS